MDARWRELQPGWGRKEYDGERKMLPEDPISGENIAFLSECDSANFCSHAVP